MTYQVLARKWRPQTFDAVVGQEAVTGTLRNALASGRVAHAYLFTGPRGVGKTTTARLLARALACTARQGPEACGACPSCLDFAAGAPVDVLEIDAASNSRVEEMRTLVENVRYAPARSRVKVYIVDEVHMLSGHAFNAFLKTLEEPPPHVVFILATTDPRKIPPTVLSRCQRFDFRPIPPEVLTARLTAILEEERVPFEPGALPLLVRASEGSLRDALSLLDAAIAYGQGRLGEASLASLLGASAPAQVRGFVAALLARDGVAALEAIDRTARQGEDLEVFCRDALETARRLLVRTVAPGAVFVELGEAEGKELTGGGEPPSVDEQVYLLRALLDAQAEMRRSPFPRVELEIAAVRATQRPRAQGIADLLARVEEAERRLRVGGGAPQTRPAASQPSLLDPPAAQAPARPPLRRETASRPVAGRPAAVGPGERPPLSGGSGRTGSVVAPGPETAGETPPPGATSGPEEDDPEGAGRAFRQAGPEEDLARAWSGIVAEVMARKALLGAVLQHATPLGVSDGTLVLGLTGSPFHAEQVGDRANQEIVLAAARERLPGVRRIQVGSDSGPGAGALQHPMVQAALGAFGAEVVAVRPRPPEEGEPA